MNKLPALAMEVAVLHWHAMESGAVLATLGSSPTGLPAAEVARRRERFGPNLLVTSEPPGWWELLVDQFRDFMVMMLLAATVVSALLGEVADAITIIAIVVLNAGLGLVQEYRAERSLQALRRLTAPTAWVVRDGGEHEVPAADLVPGDVILLEAGDRVPADVRLLEAVALEVDEALLTGESLPVRKWAAVVAGGDLALTEQVNMAFMGTVITKGRARAVVVATAMDTQMGAIASSIEGAGDDETPLQRRLDHLGRYLVAACLFVCGLVAVAGVMRGEPWFQMFLAGVSLAVAAVPEGLPAVVTVALALGVQRMARRRAIIRRLPAVETLGCATVICSDKTGTITRSELMLRTVALCGGAQFEASGSGYDPQGEFTLVSGTAALVELQLALEAGALCNRARVVVETTRRGLRLERRYRVHGDPTEAALLVAARKAGLDPDGLPHRYPLVDELPFTSERRCMSVVVRHGAGLRVYTKGAPDTVLAMCTAEREGGAVRPLSAAARARLSAQADGLAAGALRVLALAYCDLPPAGTATPESDLVYLGCVGFWDPPRPEAAGAVLRCRQAGIRPVMITGDHPATARAVARAVGILPPDGNILTGRDLDRLDDPALARRLDDTYVFARVSPHHKLRLVRALRAQGHVVAMTGDGVNDAPAVKEADIGVAMGLTGTDVTKEASDMVLADDNFATILAAVEEGRAIYDNIRKFIRYLLSCNVGEVLVMFGAVLLGWPLPLVPMQILWVNLVTDGLPAMALGVEPAEPGHMRRPPRPPGESVFARGLSIKILVRGIMIAISTGLVFAWCLGETGDIIRARTLAFVTLVFCQLFHVFECRSEGQSMFELGLGSNPWLVAATATSVFMTLLVVGHPALQPHFYTTRLAPEEWMAALAVSGLSPVLNAFRYFASRLREGLIAPGLNRRGIP